MELIADCKLILLYLNAGASESHKHQMISDNSTRWTVYTRQMTKITQESNICNWLLLYMQGHEVQSNDWRLTRLQLDAANK